MENARTENSADCGQRRSNFLAGNGKPDLLLINLRTIGTHHCDQTVGEEAAQEIEGLREQLRLSIVDQVNAEAEANDARAEIEALRAEVEGLRDLCDDLYSDLLAAGSLAPRDCGAYALIQETIKLRRDRWARKHAPNA